MVKEKNMSNNLKPWFRDDIARAMISIYFTSLISGPKQHVSDEYRTGFAAALSSMAIVIGINPESILRGEELQLLRDACRSQS
jgi:hypothetical protein